MKLTISAVLCASLLTASCLVLSAYADSGPHIAKVTDIEGTVTLFTHPSQSQSENEQGPPPHALFNGIVYSVQPVKPGDAIDNGNILRTAPGSKVRVIYPNGDQFYVGPQTSYRISWKEGDDSGSVGVDLSYGGIRGVIQKGGPMRHLTIHTRAAVMGVRGTDFYIGEESGTNETKISVLRGQVEVKSDAPQAKPVPVSAGFSAKLAGAPVTKEAAVPTHPAPGTPADPVFEPVVRKTSKEELHDIQTDAVIHPAPNEQAAPPAPEIQALQKKAFETTLQDIKTSDPKIFAQIQRSGVKSVDDLNRRVVEKEAAVAPSMPETARKRPTAEQERRREEERRKLEESDFNGAQ